ncbi:hypothetical protein H2Y56_11605 [Pectobacterium aroidearum]|uniref:Transglycosylase SLT domain-containing protein n=1 Tax=Pectobacterium aroidearum TaxID=1201031 RepID=A0ABR5ZDU8_9GAMM|nr:MULTISPECIES: hypothetical protein [Pectobacterium]MBA5200247.1 hypothetical protein [Pectobacterium aroidearum]MBA5228393.1 hypothetical protein [Pectobacterium aroidearum]MBA5232753.1 hypothetical protein [Pectobacterium aroidearum]MBA5737917.1 hypothetical protein [Pectobacterium aroidearum]UXK00861.1 hypothetical protein N5056_02375 [Pectobacterium aroidearum]
MSKFNAIAAECDLSFSDWGKNYPRWSSLDAAWWKTFGGNDYLNKYKDSYIVFHREKIKEISRQYKIPAILLASVAHAEAGGMVDYFKYPTLFSRQVVYSYSNWLGKEKIIPPPEKTSIGIIAMQIRVVAEIFGKNPSALRNAETTYISICLNKDNFNLTMVARHLYELINYDYLGTDTLNLTDEQFILAGSRYNRGIQRSRSDLIRSINAEKNLKEVREWTSYGRSMLNHREKITKLLYEVTTPHQNSKSN